MGGGGLLWLEWILLVLDGLCTADGGAAGISACAVVSDVFKDMQNPSSDSSFMSTLFVPAVG